LYSCIRRLSPALTSARSDDLLLAVQVVLVTLGVAAAALEGLRRLEDVPQRPRARLAVGREVVERGDELVALVGHVGRPLAQRHRLRGKLLLPLALTFVGVQDLHGDGGN